MVCEEMPLMEEELIVKLEGGGAGGAGWNEPPSFLPHCKNSKQMSTWLTKVNNIFIIISPLPRYKGVGFTDFVEMNFY